MARIAGVNIPDNKHIVISLRYVYGVGPTTAKAICEKTGIVPSTRTSELSPEQLDDIMAGAKPRDPANLPPPSAQSPGDEGGDTESPIGGPAEDH